jgi:hypothetical protein
MIRHVSTSEWMNDESRPFRRLAEDVGTLERVESGSSPLPFDPEKYRKYLAETGWSEKVQDEWLETLWMMCTIVDLAWGTDSVQTVLKTERPSSSETLQPKAQRTSNPRNIRNSLKKTGKCRRI